MTEREVRIIVQGYKEDFHRKTGRYIRIEEVGEWEFEARFTDTQQEVNIERIAQLVCEYADWDINQTFSPSRIHEFVIRRNLIYFIAVNNGVSLVKCAKFNGVDHTTIMHAVRRYENLLDTDRLHVKMFKEVIEWLKNHYFMTED